MKPLKIIFAGTGEFGIPTLETLISDTRFEMPFIITALDKEAGRGLQITPNPIKTTAVKNKLFIQQPHNIKELKQKIIQTKPDLLLVISYGEIIPEEILSIPKLGSINIHASLLPKYRGASPIQEAILNGDKITGVTWILMNKKIDQGNIIAQKQINIGLRDSYEILSEKLARIAALNTSDILLEYVKNPTKTIKQTESKVSYCRKITKNDGFINVYRENASQIERKIRAYFPWPGCYIVWKGKRLKIIKTDVVEQKNDTGGIKSIDNKSLVIATLKGSIVPQIVQLEGKKLMGIEDFLQGQKQIPKKL